MPGAGGAPQDASRHGLTVVSDDPSPGHLLVATPLLADPNFYRAVVFLFAEDEGPAGVILNRPSDLTVEAVLPSWASAAAEPAVVHAGGPVAPEHALALAAGIHDEMVTDDLGIVDLEAAPESVATGTMRVFAGYAGWAPGQLAGELAEHAWFVIEGGASDVLDPEPSTLWRRVLRRQSGPVRRFADYPEDPRLN